MSHLQSIKWPFHLKLTLFLCFDSFILVHLPNCYKYFLYSYLILVFWLGSLLYLIQETRQQGSGEGQSTLSIRDSCSSSQSDKALYCTATLHTRTVHYHNTEENTLLVLSEPPTNATRRNVKLIEYVCNQGLILDQSRQVESWTNSSPQATPPFVP